MAGTTVADDGGVLAAFAAAIGRCGLAEGTPAHDQAMKTARVTMGQSKIEVFRQIFTDEADAQRANAAFEECYAAAVAAGGVEAVPGAVEVIGPPRRGGHPGMPGHRFRPRYQGRHHRQARLAAADRPGALARRRRAWPSVAGHPADGPAPAGRRGRQ